MVLQSAAEAALKAARAQNEYLQRALEANDPDVSLDDILGEEVRPALRTRATHTHPPQHQRTGAGAFNSLSGPEWRSDK